MIKLAIFDVDGVFTDGSFYYDSSGKILKKFGAHDADGIKLLQDNNIDVLAISADRRGAKISKARMDDMGIPFVVVSAKDRPNWIGQQGEWDVMSYMGDGIHDVACFKKVRFSLAPKNALSFVKQNASFVTDATGGDGAVFEACMKIIDVNNKCMGNE